MPTDWRDDSGSQLPWKRDSFMPTPWLLCLGEMGISGIKMRGDGLHER